MAQRLKHLPAMQETWVQSLGREIPWRRNLQPTPVFLPAESHGQRSLVGYSPQGLKESDMSEQLHFHFSSHSRRIGAGCLWFCLFLDHSYSLSSYSHLDFVCLIFSRESSRTESEPFLKIKSRLFCSRSWQLEYKINTMGLRLPSSQTTNPWPSFTSMKKP